MSLATKYRPIDFNEVIGQDNTIETLIGEALDHNIKQSYLFVGNSGCGKAQPLYSKILTPNGYVNMGNIHAGDSIFGEDGKIHKVVSTFFQGEKDVYRVTFDDNSTCECCDEHLWTVSCDNGKTWETHQLKDLMQGYSSYCIPMTAPLEFENNNELPLDPWILGMILGNGFCDENELYIFLPRTEHLLKMNGFLSYINARLVLTQDIFPYFKFVGEGDNNPVFDIIKNLGLIKDKFIPEMYLYASVENRMKLIKGLVDSSSHIDKIDGGWYITREFVNGVDFLVQSLGGTCTTIEREMVGKEVSFLQLIKLPNVIDAYFLDQNDLIPKRKIENIEYIGKDYCRCIKTDNPSQLYLTDDMIVTHNTTTARILSNKINGQTIEIDAASNNSAESMRNLIECVKQKPLTHDYLVVIVDECGNLSKVAWDTLLKIIEEPPKHLIFIFCTTEVDKIPQTIYNRCEVYNFTSINSDKIKDRLEKICKQEKFKYEDNALWIISHRANGSMRQAISYLEQCSCKDITSNNVKSILIADSFDTYLNLFYAVVDNNIDNIKTIINGVSNINKFTEQFFCFVVDVNIYIKTNNIELTDIPYIYKTDFDDFNTIDKQFIETLTSELLKLQYEGRNSPILKYLLLAVLMEVSNKEVVPF